MIFIYDLICDFFFILSRGLKMTLCLKKNSPKKSGSQILIIEHFTRPFLTQPGKVLAHYEAK